MTTVSDIQRAALNLAPGRHLIAVAGAPASGKSTFAETLARDLTQIGRRAQVVPMDGFHLDNALLDSRGDRARKGAPHTFDARGFVRLMQDIAKGGAVIYPLFDRNRDLAVAGAGELAANTELVIVEGNYLLFDAPVWRDLAALWSLSVFLDVPEKTLRERLMQRWRQQGMDSEAAFAKVRENDLPNAGTVITHRLPAQFTLTETDWACPQPSP
ncbi:AAA family ATPase [Oceaniovalibus sp. ACAM 378]|uniref:AAA family ATPase n=1 Tax=Oceaniovalibus sp. ACAM 378 TaxID=2599923 RepID=UPI0011D75463|nr:AAA family ATPase [Oceaniovalibus sp. ACAM 378]TYB91071.1 AAA family ATPase [Oceaniovalibus sp. ACAM 378]